MIFLRPTVIWKIFLMPIVQMGKLMSRTVNDFILGMRGRHLYKPWFCLHSMVDN